MDRSYVPAGRWVRVRTGGDQDGGELQGRWHLATEDPRFTFSLTADRALVACGRNLAASGMGSSLALSGEMPRSSVCSICTERYIRDRLFEIRVHNLTTGVPA